jgi:hypothetical protein
MDLRGLANTVSDTVNPNISVTVLASTGYMIGPGLKQIPTYALPVTGFAQVQALTQADLRHLDGLNIQGATQSIIVRGTLDAVMRFNSKGGDLVSIGNQTWLTVAVLEQWSLWTRAAIQLQDGGSMASGYSGNEIPSTSGAQFTLAHSPNPPQGLQLFVESPGFGWVLLDQGPDYTLSGGSITIVNGNTYAAISMRAWYHY